MANERKARRLNSKTLLVWAALALCASALYGVTWRHSHLNQELLAAIEREDEAAVRLALRHGANPNTRHSYENGVRSFGDAIDWITRSDRIFWHECSALHEACQRRNAVPIVSALLENGANPDGLDNLKFTPLLECIEQDPEPIVRLLLKHGANVNARTHRNDTALMLIAGNQFASVNSITTLFEFGADASLRNSDGKTAMQLARESHHQPAIRALIAAGVKP